MTVCDAKLNYLKGQPQAELPSVPLGMELSAISVFCLQLQVLDPVSLFSLRQQEASSLRRY